MALSNIDRVDVISIAEDLNIKITEEQIQAVLDMYNFEEECDPHATWDLIVEHCIQQVIN